jgi:hypothetical protein
MIDLNTTSSNLSTSIVKSSILEILMQEDMLTKDKKDKILKRFNSNQEKETKCERFMLSLLIAVKGRSVDIKSIADFVNQS